MGHTHSHGNGRPHTHKRVPANLKIAEPTELVAPVVPPGVSFVLQPFEKDALQNLVNATENGYKQLGRLTLEFEANKAALLQHITRMNESQKQRFLDYIAAKGLNPNEGQWHLDLDTSTVSKRS